MKTMPKNVDAAPRLPLTTPSRRALDALRALRTTTRDAAWERVRGRARSGVETVDGTVARALVRGAARVFMRRRRATVEDEEKAEARGTRRDDAEDDDVRYVYEYRNIAWKREREYSIIALRLFRRRWCARARRAKNNPNANRLTAERLSLVRAQNRG